MNDSYHHLWDTLRHTRPLNRALVLSLFAHAAAGMAVSQAVNQEVELEPPLVIMWEMELLSTNVPVTEPEVEEPPPTPPPPPPPPPPKPKPKPKPEPPPEVKVAKVVEPEPKPKPKPPPEPEPKPVKPKPAPEVKKPPEKTGIQMQQRLPTLLDVWGRLVMHKVNKFWAVPGGIKIDPENGEAVISFWVDRDGNVIGRPEIVTHASDKALGESGIRAILAATPLPPLPLEYEHEEQQVVYGFALVK